MNVRDMGLFILREVYSFVFWCQVFGLTTIKIQGPMIKYPRLETS